MQQTILLEIGNSTMKLALVRGEHLSGIERYDNVDGLVQRCLSLDVPIICAPVGVVLSEQMIGQLQGREMRVLSRDDFTEFISDSYDTPETLGLDRILNLVGLNSDGIAISCGTAITVDAVVNGKPVWGAIMPGFRTAAEGLHARVPALPLVELNAKINVPARTSHQSVANGVLLGTALAAQRLATRLVAGRRSRIVLTGGDAKLLAELWEGEKPEVDEALVFRGIIAWEPH